MDCRITIMEMLHLYQVNISLPAKPLSLLLAMATRTASQSQQECLVLGHLLLELF
jgi:hypothetical protein